MSKGIRLYEHTSSYRRVRRDNYNVPVGLQMIDALRESKKLLEIFAIGCEEGAMVVHYRWRK